MNPPRFALCGHPITHSLSPRLFAAAYPRSPYRYELIPSSQPEEAIRLFSEGGFTGMNVTAPLKTAILPYTDQQTPECAAIGACNLIIRQNNHLIAHNTDISGVSGSLAQAQVAIKGAVCLLLGAGGAARAAAYTLLQEGATLIWANRTLSHIPNPFHQSSVIPIPLYEAMRHLPACSIIINTLPTSVPDTKILHFAPGQIVLDASYSARPLEQQVRQAGAGYIGGERWLLHQAIPSFLAMTGIEPDKIAMERILPRGRR